MYKIKKYTLIIFLFTHIPFLFSYLYQDPQKLLDINIDLGDAFFFHSFCIVSFLFGYLLIFSSQKENETSTCIYSISSNSLRLLFFFAAFGLFVTVAQIALSQSVISYIQDLFSGNVNEEVRDSYLLSSSEGGLPGIIKMFNNAPLAVYLFLTSISVVLSFDDESLMMIKKIQLYSLYVVLIKVIFSLDRLSVMAVILSFLFRTSKDGIKVKFLLFLLFSFFLANFLSQSRLNGYTIIDFVLLYMKLGLINLQLNMDFSFQYTMGFETFFHPLKYISPSFVSALGIKTPDYQWIWNPALYFVSYSYLDFGYFTFFIYILIGLFCAYLDVVIYTNRYKCMAGIYLMVLYCLASFVFVPALRGMEFMLAIFIGFFSSLFLVRKQ